MDVGSGWSVEAGTWSIESGTESTFPYDHYSRLKGCGTGTKILQAFHGPDVFSVQVEVTFSTLGQKARIFFGGDDTAACYVEIEAGPLVFVANPFIVNTATYYFRLFDASGNQVGDTRTHVFSSNLAPAFTYGPLFVGICVWSDGDNYRIVTAGFPSYDYNVWQYWYRLGEINVTTFPGDQIALGGDDAGSCLYFDRFYILEPTGGMNESLWIECLPCRVGCAYAKWDEVPSCLRLTYSGFAPGDCEIYGQSPCSCLDRSMYLGNQPSPAAAYESVQPPSCTWTVCDVPSTWYDYCFPGSVWHKAYLDFSDGHYWLCVKISTGSGFSETTLLLWRSDLGPDKPEAMSLDVSDFELVTNNFIGCDATNVTLRVEAVDGHTPCVYNTCLESRCPACLTGGCDTPELRLQASGFGDERDGDFVLSFSYARTSTYGDCCWQYNGGSFGWTVYFYYNNQPPSNNIWITAGPAYFGIYGSQAWPINCTSFSKTLTDGTHTLILSNV